jgi:glycosyltransferase involved in cell wall biosynthesis/uncharacterized UPF0146 family protein
MGFEVSLCANGDKDVVGSVGDPSFECLEYDDLPGKLDALEREPGETIVHAWTPRELVRHATVSAAGRLGAPYIVHLEDNEEHLVAEMIGVELSALKAMPVGEQDRIVGLDRAHPAHYPDFMRAAAGVTVITEELNEFNFGDRPHHLTRPGVDTDRFAPQVEPRPTRSELGLRPEDFVLVYHGIMHHANQREIFSLYLAVRLLQRRGYAVKLVRVGETYVHGIDFTSFAAMSDAAIETGGVPWSRIPGYLALADAFVQPGAPDDFNRYRLPSKIPEFLAMGRPVVLPDCNIAADLTHGENALLLADGRAVEIADQLEPVLKDPALADRLGRGARRFAIEHLSWSENGNRLAGFYRNIARSARNGEGSSMQPPDHPPRSQQEGGDGTRPRPSLRARAAGAMRAVGPSRRGEASRAVDDAQPVVHVPPIQGNASRALVPDEELWRISERYMERFSAPPISYCTVRDWADSLENLGGLARASLHLENVFDMKNVQRCWALKAVLGSVNPGGRVVEVGAGEPLIAGTLSRLGYEVIVVDPYDGRGNGPREYEAYARAYPDLAFVRDRFPPREAIEDPVDAVYSISVLEHVPTDEVEHVVAAARELVARTGGCCVHAIDHVVKGWGAEEHAERLARIAAASGLDGELLGETLERLDDDPDTYFVSAEAHNAWRGSLPYDDYPMRRIASVNLFGRA